ncbi:unnamed protein product, partial [marine sediment metagenome]
MGIKEVKKSITKRRKAIKAIIIELILPTFFSKKLTIGFNKYVKTIAIKIGVKIGFSR